MQIIKDSSSFVYIFKHSSCFDSWDSRDNFFLQGQDPYSKTKVAATMLSMLSSILIVQHAKLLQSKIGFWLFSHCMQNLQRQRHSIISYRDIVHGIMRLRNDKKALLVLPLMGDHRWKICYESEDSKINANFWDFKVGKGS